MKNIKLKSLFQKLLNRQISSAENDILQEQIELSSDSELENSLKQLWDEYDEMYVIDDKTNKEITSYLHSNMQIKKEKLYHNWWFRAAAVVGICALFALGLLKEDATVTEQEYLIVQAPKGERSKLILPEGSSVWLNANSELSFPTNFSKTNRFVKLKGEAYFEVNKQDGQNFVVELNNIEVEVLGTQFSISNYEEDEDINIILKEGAVQINEQVNHSLIKSLKPNDMFSYSKQDEKWIVEKCDPTMEMLWVENVLRFENTLAPEIFKKLERWYGVNIQVENMRAETRYGFTLKHESLQEALQLINRISPITYTIKGEEVHISYR